MSRENIELIVILNEARKCIMQNTNMNEHCTYTIKQIEKGQDLVKKLTIPDVVGQSEQLKCDCCEYEYDTLIINTDGKMYCTDCAD